jgi:hypothetical protein
MTDHDSDKRPLIVRLSCGHTGTLADRDTYSPHRVVASEDDWSVESLGTWCAACVTGGRAPVGIGWGQACDEVARRQDAQWAPYLGPDRRLGPSD